MAHGVQQITPGLGISGVLQVGHPTLCHQVTAAFAGARADVDDVLGVANGVFVVLHHHQSDG